MGMFVNPNYDAFKTAVDSNYVDKSLLIAYTNQVLGTQQAYICNSRPRRFGKSTAANMLAAYYSRGCASDAIFANLAIAKSPTYRQQLNGHAVIHLDVQWIWSAIGDSSKVVDYIHKNVLKELLQEYPNVDMADCPTLPEALAAINEQTGTKFIIIIDEWDCLIRDDGRNKAVIEAYIEFLRALFKGLQPSRYLNLAYITGILPIMKINTQSAMNNFREFTMLNPGPFAPFIGFTEGEVQAICTKHQLNFAELRRWFDGYKLGQEHIYNPNAVIDTIIHGKAGNYWSATASVGAILPLIRLDFTGLRQVLLRLLGGESIKLDVTNFSNDMLHFHDVDDILTALIHLGYLAYDEALGQVFIPNEEIRKELGATLKREKWTELNKLMASSEALLAATWEQNGAKVALMVEEIHNSHCSILQYNNENALSNVMSFAYLAAIEYYYKPVRELPAGRGFADLVFLPRREYPHIPALLLELKWNASARTALQQIKEKHYSEALEDYCGTVLLVGINYDPRTKAHSCEIEELADFSNRMA